MIPIAKKRNTVYKKNKTHTQKYIIIFVFRNLSWLEAHELCNMKHKQLWTIPTKEVQMNILQEMAENKTIASGWHSFGEIFFNGLKYSFT